jgi:hypothetical protein
MQWLAAWASKDRRSKIAFNKTSPTITTNDVVPQLLFFPAVLHVPKVHNSASDPSLHCKAVKGKASTHVLTRILIYTTTSTGTFSAPSLSWSCHHPNSSFRVPQKQMDDLNPFRAQRR